MFYRDENNEWQEIILEPSGDTLPIGTITQYGGNETPTNWLICDGSAISRTDYSELFNAIGTTYGTGDGSTTFNLPDFKGRVPVGLKSTDTDFDTIGETGGEKTHTLTIDEMPSHQHASNGYAQVNDSSGAPYKALISNGSDITQKTRATGGGEAHNNLQPYIVTNYIIKAKQSVGVVGTVSEDITDIHNEAIPNCKTVKDYVDDNKSLIIDITSIVPLSGATTANKKAVANQIKSAIDLENYQLQYNPVKLTKPIYLLYASDNVSDNRYYHLEFITSNSLTFKNEFTNQFITITISGDLTTISELLIGNDYNPTTYSTTETKIGTWLGNDLYRKVLNIGNADFYSSTDKNFAHNITNLGQVIDIKYSMYFPGDSSWYIQWDKIITVKANSTHVKMTTGTLSAEYISFTNMKIIIEYTKTS